MNCFEKWDGSIHYAPDQVKRRLSGEKIKCEAISLDTASMSAAIIGSDPEPYSVTLSGCSCFDFTSRGLPCKHMYRLADELGLSDPWPKVSRKGQAATLEAAPTEVERWRSEFMAGNISAKKYVKIADALFSK